MEQGYTLEWFDYLVTISLNPTKTNLDAILPEQIILLKSKIDEEKVNQKYFLKKMAFTLLEENKISLLLNQYYSSLTILLDQALDNYKNIKNKRKKVNELLEEIINCIEEMLSFIQVHFPNYLGLNRSIPVTHISYIDKLLKEKTAKLKIELRLVTNTKLIDIIFDDLDYLFLVNKENRTISFKEMEYVKQILNELELLVKVERNRGEDEVFTILDKILINLNFNSEDYIEYITRKITNHVRTIEGARERIDFLLFNFKKFNQLNRKVGFCLSLNQPSLSETLCNWFEQEIIYFEKKLQFSNLPFNIYNKDSNGKTILPKVKQKVLCIFSTDQIAISLRALDELKILKARSMTEVFKTIVPHLSTPYKDELSYDSVRSKSYAAEESDKMIVIETLQQVINTIKRY
ncbi:MAG: hypothetical protein ABI784_03765 [Ginsengibacter sp.]